MNQLLKKLKIVRDVNCLGWSLVPKLVAIMDTVTVREKRWADQFKQNHPEMYPLDLSNIKTWSTFDECVTLTFTFLNSKVIECNAIVYNGEGVYGRRRNIRFCATFDIPATFVSELEDDITYHFNDYCEDKYEEHLKRQKKEWVRKFAEKALAKPEKPLTFR